MKEAMNLTASTFKAMRFDKAILAVGSCECHGDHLPLGTDTFVSYQIAVKVAEAVEGLAVMPPVNIGFSGHYAAFPFTLSIRSEILVEMLKDILSSIINNGIKKIFIMNGHDGNTAPIEIAARAVKLQHPEARIAALNDWWVQAGKILPPGTFEVWDGLGHAGEAETSIALSLFPELVEMEKAAGVVPELPPYMDIKWNFAELTDTGATGDPTKATKEKGRLMEDVLVDMVVTFIKEMDKADWRYNSKKSMM